MARIIDYIAEKITALQVAIDNLMDKLPASMDSYIDILKSPVDLPFTHDLSALTVIIGLLLCLFTLIVIISTIGFFHPSKTTLSKWENRKATKAYEKRVKKDKIKAFKLYTKTAPKPEDIAKELELEGLAVPKEKIDDEISTESSAEILSGNIESIIDKDNSDIITKTNTDSISTEINETEDKNIETKVEAVILEDKGIIAVTKDMALMSKKELKEQKNRIKKAKKEQVKLEKKAKAEQALLAKKAKAEQAKLDKKAKAEQAGLDKKAKAEQAELDKKAKAEQLLQNKEKEAEAAKSTTDNKDAAKEIVKVEKQEMEKKTIKISASIMNSKSLSPKEFKKAKKEQAKLDKKEKQEQLKKAKYEAKHNPKKKVEVKKEIIKKETIKAEKPVEVIVPVINEIKPQPVSATPTPKADPLASFVPNKTRTKRNFDYLDDINEENKLETNNDNSSILKTNTISTDTAPIIVNEKSPEDDIKLRDNKEIPPIEQIIKPVIKEEIKPIIKEEIKPVKVVITAPIEEKIQKVTAPAENTTQKYFDNEGVKQAVILSEDMTDKKNTTKEAPVKANTPNISVLSDLTIRTTKAVKKPIEQPIKKEEVIKPKSVVEDDDMGSFFQDAKAEIVEKEEIIVPVTIAPLDADELDIDDTLISEIKPEPIVKKEPIIKEEIKAPVKEEVKAPVKEHIKTPVSLDDDEIGDLDKVIIAPKTDNKKANEIEKATKDNKHIEIKTEKAPTQPAKEIKPVKANAEKIPNESAKDIKPLITEAPKAKVKAEAKSPVKEETIIPTVEKQTSDIKVQSSYTGTNATSTSDKGGFEHGQFQIIQEADNYRFILMSNTAEIIFASRTYKNMASCITGSQTFKKNVTSGEFIIDKDKFGSCKFILSSKNNTMVKYFGELYRTEAECIKNINEVKKYALIAPVIFRN